MGKSFDIAIVGAATALGEELLKLLAERKFPFGQVHLLGTKAGEFVDFADDTLEVQDVAGFDFARARIAFFLGGEDEARAYAPRAAAAGCVAVDASSAFRGDAQVPLVAADVNADAIGALPPRGIVAMPSSAATQLAIVLKPIHQTLGIERVGVVSYRPASADGKAGIEELARQSACALNGMAIETRGKRPQIAFNIIPQVGAIADNGYTEEEIGLVTETRRLLGDAALAVNVSAAQVPVFYGQSMAVNVETRRKASAAELRRLLAQAPGVRVTDRHDDGGYPTAVGEAATQDAVFVGRIREDLSHPRGLNLWVVADNVRKGGALNAIQIAERMVERHLRP